jgi:hypothetical protein
LPEQFQKLALGESHRRVVSAVLRRVESTCDEVLEWLERSGGELRQLREDVAPSQSDALRKLVIQLRKELRCVQEEVIVDSSEQSRSRGIAASVSLTRIELEEVLTPGLRGYGELPPEQEAALDAKFNRLIDCLEAMSDVVERSSFRGAP